MSAINRYIKINKVILKTDKNEKIIFDTDYKFWSFNYWIDKYDIILSDLIEELYQEENLIEKIKDFLNKKEDKNFKSCEIEDVDFTCLK